MGALCSIGLQAVMAEGFLLAGYRRMLEKLSMFELQRWPLSWLGALSAPLGLCALCNTFWLTLLLGGLAGKLGIAEAMAAVGLVHLVNKFSNGS